jgi:hypothetical protein
MDWQVTIDTHIAQVFPEQILDDLVEVLDPYSASIGLVGRRMSVTLTVDDASDPGDALAQGRLIWHGALIQHQIGILKDISGHAMVYALVDEELKEPTIPELWGAHEAAQHLGVSRQRIHQLTTENRSFPTPVVRIGLGPLWTRASIEAFDAAWERKPGRPSLRIAGSTTMTAPMSPRGAIQVPRIGVKAAKGAPSPVRKKAGARKVAAPKAAPGRIATVRSGKQNA